jgi:hypothetical protein
MNIYQENHSVMKIAVHQIMEENYCRLNLELLMSVNI